MPELSPGWAATGRAFDIERRGYHQGIAGGNADRCLQVRRADARYVRCGSSSGRWRIRDWCKPRRRAREERADGSRNYGLASRSGARGNGREIPSRRPSSQDSVHHGDTRASSIVRASVEARMGNRASCIIDRSWVAGATAIVDYCDRVQGFWWYHTLIDPVLPIRMVCARRVPQPAFYCVLPSSHGRQ